MAHTKRTTATSSAGTSNSPKSSLTPLLTRRWIMLGGALLTGCAAVYTTQAYWGTTAPVRLGRQAKDIPVDCPVPDATYKQRVAWRNQLPRRLQPFPLMPTEQVNSKLAQNERSVQVGDRNRGPEDQPVVWRYDTNQVASNARIEDYYQSWALSSDVQELVQGTAWLPSDLKTDPRWLFFAVFDGHGGYQCSEYVSQHLPNHIQRALKWTLEAKAPDSNQPWDDIEKMRAALAAGFVTMDDELINGSLQKVIKEPQQAQKLLAPAVAGACGLVASYDTQLQQLSVACTGDSRAVLGTLDSTTGRWTATPLSTDQTADNPAELQRLYAEHPNEKDTVIRRGRILGSLQPTRSFGDARYKWPEDIQAQIFTTQFPGRRATPPHYLTPPYVTATPVITTQTLTKHDKFLVIATDGLYDELGNAEIVQTVAEFWEAKVHSPEVDHAKTLDNNAATHLIRKAFGGDDPEIIGRLLSIPPPKSRSNRDDITITVIFFD
ncbi:[Pyruvate dehydrogenase [acetyl-transferring]]-phosphatase 1, mitochondrial [Dispira parvispora]|uniref:[Pyruvate dehydrogenase [acetyl-transferring]]-phosphatase 1, mitochondrial n=1 Tax=Dispira parvispora TaxID=1520584 RepID=A0A9W8E828_9FUNG|nr:[Pyruvate dehydrogenase [acetyl-transferring]]-phosphatase 1, mitochondrial [Dispira parvispora]